MLARTFKTAAELGIPEHEAHALQTVLYMLEDGEIKKEMLYMGNWHGLGACGTTHCLAGWANAVDERSFPEVSGRAVSMPKYRELEDRLPIELRQLFGMDNRLMLFAGAAVATASLRHYLETGICNRK